MFTSVGNRSASAYKRVSVETSVDGADPHNLVCLLFVALQQALGAARGPVVVVGNEIGLGVIPMGREVRAFVDALGRLNQDVAQHCQRVTLMAAAFILVVGPVLLFEIGRAHV